jgi:hypothetical protein
MFHWGFILSFIRGISDKDFMPWEEDGSFAVKATDDSIRLSNRQISGRQFTLAQ